MASADDVRITAAPHLARGGRGLLRWVCTNNPFYVLSAGLFLAGLRLSFGAAPGEVETWGLMSGLAGYTLLLAGTACLLVRFGNVWDDVRTVLLLVVLLFLATSVTFDDVLVFHPDRGFACYLGGLLFAALVSEGLFRGIRLRLPAPFRVPYYLILGLFFLYPLALRPLVDDPRGEALRWGLFGFAAAQGLAFLTLLPAARRGADLVRDNGSPWRWPLYPWVLFGVLAFAVPARAYLLCRSLHLIESGGLHQLLFGPYFLVPFGLALAVLLLEIGFASRSRGAVAVAMLMPVGLSLLTLVGHRFDPVYWGFLKLFTRRLADPLTLTLAASAAFYAAAALRRVRGAADLATAALVVLAFVGPDTFASHLLVPARPALLLAAAGVQLWLGAWRHDSFRCLLAAAGLVAAASLAVPDILGISSVREVVAFHLGLVAAWVVGAVFDDRLARRLRLLAAVAVPLACLALVSQPAGRYPEWVPAAYVVVMAVVLAGCGWFLRHRISLWAAGLALGVWVVGAGSRAYGSLRGAVAGLDHIAWSLALFAVAVLISLGKAGLLKRALLAWWARVRLSLSLEGGAPGHAFWRPAPAPEELPHAGPNPGAPAAGDG
jgi:hypothetical protein